MPSDSCLNDYRGEQKTVALKSTRRSHGLPYLKVSMSFISGMSKGTHQIVTQLDYKFTILYTYAKYDIYIYIYMYIFAYIYIFIYPQICPTYKLLLSRSTTSTKMLEHPTAKTPLGAGAFA